MADWHVAPALARLRDRFNVLYPHRADADDGTIAGDEHHKQNPNSDHEVDANGVVKALDITHDVRHGVDTYKIADYMIAHPDTRLRYIISNRRIAGSASFVNSNYGGKHKQWTWFPYTGDNPHDHHMHFSIERSPALYNDEREWDIGPVLDADDEAPSVQSFPLLKPGSRGVSVKALQEALKVKPIDGDFGPATEVAVRDFQRARGLVIDGRVGRQTWNAINTARPADAPPAALAPSETAPAAPVVPQSPGGTTTPLQRLEMAKRILDFEARRDSKGHLQVYKLPANDGGGSFEVGGINEKYDGPMARKLAALVQGGHYAEAEEAAIAYIAGNTDAAAAWTTNPAVESYLRDCVFNRGAGGAVRILQRALGIHDDGKVGDLTKAAAILIPPDELLLRLRAAREDYERNVVGYRANFWQGLKNRWDKALKTAQGFL